MFEIVVKEHFSAAHRIDGYPGSCSNLHGHNWNVEMCLRVEKLNELGMAFDFREAKKVLRDVIQKLDHTFLNDNSLLAGGNPTAERIAMVIFDEISLMLPKDVKIVSITVWESDSAAVKYLLE